MNEVRFKKTYKQKGMIIMKKKLSIVLVLAVVALVFVPMTGIYAKTAKTRDEAVAWANSRVGQYAYNMDAAYGAQCVDFIQEYYNFLGVSGGGGNAIDYASNTLPSGFTRIADYIGFVPEPGDIGIWYGNNGNPYGHVGIVLSANLDNVTVADVWGSQANINHNYVGYDNNEVHKITRPYQYSETFCQGNFWGVIRPDFGSASSSKIQTAVVSEGECYLKNLNVYMSAYEDYNGGNVFASSTFDNSIQKFNIQKSGGGYKIQSCYNNTQRVVNVWTTDYSKCGDNVTLYDQTGHSTQTWVFEPHGDGYIIHPADNLGLALTVQSNGNVAIETSTAISGQIWKIESPIKVNSGVIQENSRDEENYDAEIQVILMKIGQPTMFVGEELMEIDPGRGTVPIIQNGRTLVPIRAIVEAMNGNVEWDGAKNKISIKANGHKINMWLGSKKIEVDGKKKSMDVAPNIINDRTMLPIRFIVENIGYDIEWMASTQQILIEF